MRRSVLVKLLGISEEQFNLVRARKLLPMRGRDAGRGWQDFTADDALALELATALSRQGVKKSVARDVVDGYYAVALEWAGNDLANQTVFVGIVRTVALVDGELEVGSHEWLVGSAADIAEQIDRLREAVGTSLWVDGAVVANLNLCVASILARADMAGIQDDRLSELAAVFQLPPPSTPKQGLFE